MPPPGLKESFNEIKELLERLEESNSDIANLLQTSAAAASNADRRLQALEGDVSALTERNMANDAKVNGIQHKLDSMTTVMANLGATVSSMAVEISGKPYDQSLTGRVMLLEQGAGNVHESESKKWEFWLILLRSLIMPIVVGVILYFILKKDQ